MLFLGIFLLLNFFKFLTEKSVTTSTFAAKHKFPNNFSTTFNRPQIKLTITMKLYHFRVVGKPTQMPCAEQCLISGTTRSTTS